MQSYFDGGKKRKLPVIRPCWLIMKLIHIHPNFSINIGHRGGQHTHTTCVYSHYPLTRLGLLLLPYIPHQRLCSSHPICKDTERALRDIVSHQHIQQILTGLCNYMHLRLNSPDHFFILSSDKCQLLSHDILVSQSHRNQYRTFQEEV